mmetsp:Transcript_2478/g.5259  ORF Transcript_2478/g.5259 Transcript_2478/m.5259 type:complete len:102 (-) Transcript_2478:295-600(-)
MAKNTVDAQAYCTPPSTTPTKQHPSTVNTVLIRSQERMCIITIFFVWDTILSSCIFSKLGPKARSCKRRDIEKEQTSLSFHDNTLNRKNANVFGHAPLRLS